VKDVSSLPAKYQKLVKDMNLVKGNINFTNEIIDSVMPGEKNNETLNDLFKTLTDMEPKLFGLIGQVENEEVLSICLLVNDDLQKTFKRYHDARGGKKPGPFIPGESTKDSYLTPTHVYEMAEEGSSNSSQKTGESFIAESKP